MLYISLLKDFCPREKILLVNDVAEFDHRMDENCSNFHYFRFGRNVQKSNAYGARNARK